MKHFYRSVLILGLLTGCSTVPLTHPSTNFARLIVLNQSQMDGLAQAKTAYPDNFTYAVSLSGHWGYDRGSNERSMRSVLRLCQKYALEPCRIYSAGPDFTQARYMDFATHSLKALRSLKPVEEKNYHDEATDWHVGSLSVTRAASSAAMKESMAGGTPLTLPGIQTIRTAALVAMIRNSQPSIIDVNGIETKNSMTIPNSFLIDWLSVPTMTPAEEDAILPRLEMVMHAVQPDKNQPVVVFCESSFCRNSANAALRLRGLGYKKVFWYRGGLASWTEAGLPLVMAVPYATLWDDDISWPKS